MLDFKLTPDQPEPQSQSESEQDDQLYDLIVLGAGPAGCTAAIYAGRAALRTLVLSGVLAGGQVANTEFVENFPGFPDGVPGPELAERVRRQAEKFAAEMRSEGAQSVDFSVRPFEVRAGPRTYKARAIILATGTFPRRLGVPGEKEFYGRGVSTCATCDGFFYKDQRVVVVGGGDSAMEEGLFLTKFAREVIVVHRRDQLRATPILQERGFANPKMRFTWDSVVEEILGDQTVTGVRIRNVKTGETSVIETDGVFVYVGLIPATKILEGQVNLDESGYIITDRRQQTNVPGVFAAGDVQNPEFRQAVVAAGSGAVAAIQADRFLVEQSSQAPCP